MAKIKKAPGEKLGFVNLLMWNSRMISTSIYILMVTFLMAYCTDTLGINPLYVSIILTASKLLDGVTDACAGFIVDKTKTKWGKARPYELFIILLWVATWLMFSCPVGLSEIMKCVWIFIMYSLVNSIAYTFLNASNTVYLVRAFKGNQIVKLTSYSSVITMLASVIFNIAFPILMATYATSASGWSLLVGTFAICMTGIGILRFVFIKEKYDVDAEKKDESLKVRDALAVIKGNKFILIIALMGFLFNFVTNMGTIVYYYTWVVGDVGLMSIASAVQIIAIPLAFLFPPILKRVSVVKLMFVGFLISAFGYLLNFFAVANIPLLAVAAVFTGAGTIPGSMLITLAILECAEYNEWKGLHRMEGTMSSVVNLAKKVGQAFGTASLGVLLSIIGYNGTLETQSDTTLMGIRILFSIVPMVLYALVALSLTGYFKLDKKMPEIRKENEKNREAGKETVSEGQEQSDEC
ncbi:MAG: MFS transporter [Eubacterium sp.]|nr:MFS transporter [Eubacterium sp.]